MYVSQRRSLLFRRRSLLFRRRSLLFHRASLGSRTWPHAQQGSVDACSNHGYVVNATMLQANIYIHAGALHATTSAPSATISPRCAGFAAVYFAPLF